MTLELRNVDQLALSLFDKEASYDAGPAAWAAANACQLSGFDGIAQIADAVVDDREGVSGSEFATQKEIEKKDWSLDLSISRIKPNDLAGLAALTLGSIETAEEGTVAAYRHKIVPVAIGTALPSIGALYKQAASQYLATGIKAQSLSLRHNGSWFSLSCPLLGSGTRSSDSTEFPAKISESWLRTGKIAGIWIETGEDISIAATPAQGSENISSGTQDDLTSRLLSFEWTFNNNLRADLGYYAGGGQVRSDLEYGRRESRISLTIKALSTTWATELGYYENMDPCAIEINVDMGVVITGSGTFNYGFILIIPLTKLDPIERGVQDDFHTITLAGDVMNDGTNDEVILYVYNAQQTYLA
jgi:hypothetical protein